MKYTSVSNYRHGRASRTGIIITNLGTPDAPTTPALRRYLGEFLADPRVVEVPRLLWFLILHLIILRIRPRRSAKNYQTVWQETGSPLLTHTKNQTEALRAAFKQSHPDIVIDFAMRYGSNPISEKIQSLQDEGVNRLLILPLYPQYSASTSGSTFDALAKDFTKRRWLPDLRFISHYHDNPAYIRACATHISAHQSKHGKPQKLIFSYHGVPQSYLEKGDPYHCECHKTSRLIAQELGLSEGDYLTTFQSRFGREPWLQPYTDETLKQLPVQGVDTIQVFCPGFAADCLETIEEIDQENRHYFMEAGGKSFSYITALNAEAHHIDALKTIIEENLQGWPLEAVTTAEQYETALKLGAKQ